MDEALFQHYLARGHEPWNTSTDAAWLDYQLRDWVEALIPARTPKRVCNVGIGVGLWDDWLGHILGRNDRLLSVDTDAEVCRVFGLRQARERHPLPSIVIRGDVLDDILPPCDLITVVGSTLDEIGPHRARLFDVLYRSLAPGGRLIVAALTDVIASPYPPAVRRHARRGELALSLIAIDRA
jgi:SAM-dependent methyltransferase